MTKKQKNPIQVYNPKKSKKSKPIITQKQQRKRGFKPNEI